MNEVQMTRPELGFMLSHVRYWALESHFFWLIDSVEINGKPPPARINKG